MKSDNPTPVELFRIHKQLVTPDDTNNAPRVLVKFNFNIRFFGHPELIDKVGYILNIERTHEYGFDRYHMLLQIDHIGRIGFKGIYLTEYLLSANMPFQVIGIGGEGFRIIGDLELTQPE